jgi:hypothetical protein
MDKSYWKYSSLKWAQYDLDFYHQRFVNDSTRIFSTDKDEVEILRPPCRIPAREKQDAETVSAICVRAGAVLLD